METSGLSGVGTPAAGDALPAGVARLLAGLGAGDPEVAASGFAADATWAPPGDESDETAPRAVCRGPAIAPALAGDPQLGRQHEVRLCVHEGPDCMIEGQILADDGTPRGSHSASFQLDGDGAIRRALVFRTPPVEDNAGTDSENASGLAIQDTVDRYFAALDAARFERAAGYFAADAVYMHPPYAPGQRRVAFRGSGGILAGFEQRGPQKWKHLIGVSIQRGAHLMFEGNALVDGTPEGPKGSFLCSATVDQQGAILRYLAFYTVEMVPIADLSQSTGR